MDVVNTQVRVSTINNISEAPKALVKTETEEKNQTTPVSKDNFKTETDLKVGKVPNKISFTSSEDFKTSTSMAKNAVKGALIVGGTTAVVETVAKSVIEKTLTKPSKANIAFGLAAGATVGLAITPRDNIRNKVLSSANDMAALAAFGGFKGALVSTCVLASEKIDNNVSLLSKATYPGEYVSIKKGAALGAAFMTGFALTTINVDNQALRVAKNVTAGAIMGSSAATFLYRSPKEIAVATAVGVGLGLYGSK